MPAPRLLPLSFSLPACLYPLLQLLPVFLSLLYHSLVSTIAVLFLVSDRRTILNPYYSHKTSQASEENEADNTEMPQTQPLKDKPLHSHPEPLKDRSNVSNDTLKSSRYDGFVKGSPPRMHRGAKKPNGNGTGAAVSTETLRGAYAATRLTTGAASSIPIKPISAANPLTTISATTSSPAATTANSPTSGNIIGGHRRRRSSFFEEWSSPLSSVRGPSPEKGRQRNASSTTSPSRSSVASAGAPVAAASKTIRGPISKELITGMAPLPAPSTVVAKAPASATSAPGAASTTLKTVPAKAASVTTSTTAPNTARGAAPTAVSSAAPAVRSSPAPKPNCAPDRNITSATSPSRIPMSKTAPVPTKATVTAPASALDRKDGDTKNSSLPPKDRKPSVSGTTRGKRNFLVYNHR